VLDDEEDGCTKMILYGVATVHHMAATALSAPSLIAEFPRKLCCQLHLVVLKLDVHLVNRAKWQRHIDGAESCCGSHSSILVDFNNDQVNWVVCLFICFLFQKALTLAAAHSYTCTSTITLIAR